MVQCTALSFLLLLSTVCTEAAAEPQTTDSGLQTVPPPLLAHRPLRSNVPEQNLPATEPQVFTGYPGAPAFRVVSRTAQLSWQPCSSCHNAMTPNPVPRKLFAPHPAALDHGGGRIWCLDCHQQDDRDKLHTLAGKPVAFDAAFEVCGGCHFPQQKDWYFGAHGKRVANWQGERDIYNCTHCHNPHTPALKARAPQPPPPVRAGLERPPALSGDEAHDMATLPGSAIPDTSAQP